VGNSSVVLSYRNFEKYSHTGLRTQRYFFPELSPDDPQLVLFAESGGRLWDLTKVRPPSSSSSKIVSVVDKIGVWNGNVIMLCNAATHDDGPFLLKIKDRVSTSLCSLAMDRKHRDLVDTYCEENKTRVLALRRELLQPRLVIGVTLAAEHAVDVVGQQVEDDVGRRAGSAVEVHRTEDRLHRIREDRGLVTSTGDVLTPTQSEHLTETDAPRHPSECGGVDEFGAPAGQHTLAHVRGLPEQEVGDDDTQDGVTEELEPLVGLDAAVLGAPRAVPDREVEE
jgi:hypothetical protein